MDIRFQPCLNLYNYLTIILQGRAGYEMIYNQRGAWRRVGFDHFTYSKPFHIQQI